MNLLIRSLLIVFTLTITSCSEISSLKELKQYTFNPESGLTKSKNLGAFKISVSSLPGSYRVLNNQENFKTQSEFDSLKSSYDQSRTFWITWESNNDEFSVWDYLQSMHDQKDNLMSYLNFQIGSQVSIKTKNKTIYPVLSSISNNHGLMNKLKAEFVFVPEGNDQWSTYGDYTLNIKGLLFNLGINQFQFTESDYHKTPSFKI